MNTEAYKNIDTETLARAIQIALGSSTEKQIAFNEKPGDSHQKQKGSHRMVKYYGPYEYFSKWRVVVRKPGKGQSYLSFHTREEALKELNKLRLAASQDAGIYVCDAVEAYREYLKQKGNRSGSIRTSVQRISRLLESHWSTTLPSIKSDTPLLKGIENLSFNTRTGIVSEGRTFFRWAVEQGYTKVNPLQSTKLLGRKRRGKKQLRIDEARKFVSVALEEASPGAIACLCALVLGMRAGEIISRTVRDIDDGGRVLWISDTDSWEAKTETSNRRLVIPEMLRPLLLSLSEGKKPEQRLFDRKNRKWIWKNTKRICELAGVPVVPTHGLRGSFATLSVEAGTATQAVAAALGHHSFQVTAQHYAKPDAVASALQTRVLNTINPTTRN